jgi:uncharacterized membrane protein YcjF (UPF0283 family)
MLDEHDKRDALQFAQLDRELREHIARQSAKLMVVLAVSAVVIVPLTSLATYLITHH